MTQTTTHEADMAPLTSGSRLLQVTEVIQTAARFAVFFVPAVASTARSTEWSLSAAVESTDRSSGQYRRGQNDGARKCLAAFEWPAVSVSTIQP